MTDTTTEISFKKAPVEPVSSWTWIRQNVLVIVGILSVIGSSTYFIITFYIRSSDSWQEIKTLKETTVRLEEKLREAFKKLDEDKADKATVEANQKSIGDRLQRQYEGNNVRDARMTEIEKAAAYEKGLHEGEARKR